MSTAGWQPDPMRRHQLRWWDGSAWTEQVSDGGALGEDPLPSPPPPPLEQHEAHHEIAPIAPPGPGSGSPGGPPVAHRTHRAAWIAGAAIVGAGLIAVGLLGLRGGDDTTPSGEESTATLEPVTTSSPVDSVATTAAPTTAAPTTTAATTTTTTTTTTTVAPTTAPPTTAAPTTAAPTTAAPTTAPPTTLAPTNNRNLLAALPSVGDYPANWVVDPEDTIRTGLYPDETGGFCNGPNVDALAVDAGATGSAWGQWFEQPTTAGYYLDLYGFPTADAASGFIGAIRAGAAACSEGWTYRLPEGDGRPGTYDVFVDSDDPSTIWTITEVPYFADIDVPGVDDTLQLAIIASYETTDDGVFYSGVRTAMFQYEQLGRTVAVHSVSSLHHAGGFGNADEFTYEVDHTDLVASADAVRPVLVSNLRDLGLL